jgi:hypothetical protein
VTNASGKQTVLSAEAFAKLPRREVKAKDHAGALATYEGVLLGELLGFAGVPLGDDLKGRRLALCLLVQASDGYQVVFSLAEVDPPMTDNIVLVADRKDGKPLDAKEGPYRLVVPHDKRHSRWVRQVTEIAVRRTAESSAEGKDGKSKSPR